MSWKDDILNSIEPVKPRMMLCPGETVHATCPVRLDLAGGWTDTPPYCIEHGGTVVNLAVDLYARPPVQVWVKATKGKQFDARSLDSPIPKLHWYASEVCGLGGRYDADGMMLHQRLNDLGCGLEVVSAVDVPPGSGLGTSSILCATIIAALNEALGLGFDWKEIVRRTLVVDQLMGVGGGWQDAAGGLLAGCKRLTGAPGLPLNIDAALITDRLFYSEASGRMLLYYTGLTRPSGDVVGRVVEKVTFPENRGTINMLGVMEKTALECSECIQDNDYIGLCTDVLAAWEQNKVIDPGTTTPEIEAILDPIRIHCYGYKLLGAGGGGFLLLCCRSHESANKVRTKLTENPPNDRAAFVPWAVSQTGLVVQRLLR